MIYMGIDPGMNGAISLIFTGEDTGEGLPKTESFNFKDKTISDIDEYFCALFGMKIFCYLEKVHSMPKQGVASTFKFGEAFGIIQGLLVAHKIPFEFITPQKWQKEMECLTHGNKNVSKTKAQQLFPNVKITHANADSLLIAECCRRNYK